MRRAASSGVLVIMGSGETSPTMVTLHRRLVRGLGTDRPEAVLLETPYGFQENVADISARAQGYFSRSVDLRVSVLPGMRGHDDGGADVDGGLAALRTADWIFSGPGSPSYALEHWRHGPVARALRERVAARRGVTVLASAAAATMGRFAVPVYEIYKVGAVPRWLDGLDLLGGLGLDVAVIPHYDNTEGGTHDTRYSYLGERRLAVLEEALPVDAAVLGVDEHSAVVLDLVAETVEVTGRGGLTVRRAGRSWVLTSGTTATLADLRALVRQGRREPVPPPATVRIPAQPPARPVPPTLSELAAECERRFAAGQQGRDSAEMVRAVLELEAGIEEWAADTEEDDGTKQARAVLRTLIVRLGDVATVGLRDPGERLRPLVEPLIALRQRLRDEHAFPTADLIRDALNAGGLELRDTGRGTEWSPYPPAGD